MEAPPDKIAADLLEELDRHKTPSCLSVTVLGQYIEHTLPGRGTGRSREAPKVVPLLPQSACRVKGIAFP